jgi:hypothetical protein
MKCISPEVVSFALQSLLRRRGGIMPFLLLMAVWAPSSAGAAPTPILEYLFNEGSGTTAINSGSLGASADGAIIGGVSYSTDTPSGSGFSLDFNASSAFVQVPDAWDYTNMLTIEACTLSEMRSTANG